MRILVATTGSDGDIRPFLALAKELVRRGHDVLFTAQDRYAGLAAHHGVAFRAHGPPWVDREMADIFARILAERTPLAQLAVVMESVVDQQLEAVPELLEMASRSDLVIYPPMLIAAAAAARAEGVRHVSIQLAPVHRALDYAPNGMNLGRWLNRPMWALAKRALRRATDAKLNTIVQAAGLAPWRDVLVDAAPSPLLDLVAVSPHVVPRDPGWPASSHVSGYLFLDDEDARIDPALETFLEGARPVVVGFGSMLGFDAEATMRTILEALRGLPRKVVVQSGWAGLEASDLPPNVHLTGFVPHAWLLARSACIVHHGGAGTTAGAFRAGIPQTVVWHLGDQALWARKTVSLGVAPAFISYRRLRAAWLREQIERMCSDPGLRDAARSLGESIRAEDGTETAATMIEGLPRGP